MRLLTHFLCLSMLLACFAQAGAGSVEIARGSQHSASKWHAADSVPAPCGESIRAGQLQHIWFGQIKSRQPVICELAATDGNLPAAALFGMVPRPHNSLPTLLTQHIRLQL